MKEIIIGSTDLNGEDYSVSKTPVKHTSQDKAEKEAERLARLNPSRKFVVMQVLSVVEVQTVKITRK